MLVCALVGRLVDKLVVCLVVHCWVACLMFVLFLCHLVDRLVVCFIVYWWMACLISGFVWLFIGEPTLVVYWWVAQLFIGELLNRVCKIIRNSFMERNIYSKVSQHYDIWTKAKCPS